MERFSNVIYGTGITLIFCIIVGLFGYYALYIPFSYFFYPLNSNTIWVLFILLVSICNGIVYSIFGDEISKE